MIGNGLPKSASTRRQESIDSHSETRTATIAQTIDAAETFLRSAATAAYWSRIAKMAKMSTATRKP